MLRTGLLQALTQLLEPLVPNERGTGEAVFLFVRNEHRAVEASIDSDGEIWVEYWDSDDVELDDAPVKDETYSTVRAAAEEITAWLAHQCLVPSLPP